MTGPYATHQKRRWSTKKIILAIIGGLFLIYVSIMTYLYFYPALNFTVQLPVNPPTVLEPKLQSIQTHVDLIPGNGLGNFEFFIIPSNRTNFYANVDGGALVEEKAHDLPSCVATSSVACASVTTPGGQKYELSTTKDSSGNVTDMQIYFNRNQTNISIDLTERPRALSRSVIDSYVDSFQPVHKSFPVDHFTPGA